MSTITRPAKTVPVWESCDVLVAGGGFAGVAAALAAARNGAKTILVEKYSGLGGLGTLGHVVIYLPICDGRGRQVSFGIVEELLRLPMKYSPCKPDGVWALPDPMQATQQERMAKRYQLLYDPAPMMLGMEELLREAGVRIIYDTLICDVVTANDGAITHLIVENKSGCGAIATQAVVDCTGDADICHLCGEETEIARRNRAAAWYYAIEPNRTLHLMASAGHPYNSNDPAHPGFDGTDYRSITENLLYSRQCVLQDLQRQNLARQAKNAPPLSAFTIPSIASLRMTRRLVGPYTLTPKDLHAWHDDAVGIFSDWRKSGPVYALPLRSIIAQKTPNLTAAGRCLSATGDTWDVTRVIPVCSISGQAAGTAATLAVQTQKALQNLPPTSVQDALQHDGVRLSPDLVAECLA